jgi:hypothetical protein
MKNTLPFLLLVILALGCNKFGPGASSTSDTNSNANSNAAPAKIAKVVDLPATIGKTKDEIKKMVSATPKAEEPWLEYDLPEGYLTVQFTKQKPSSVSFRFKSISVGDAPISGTDTAEQLGTMTGIDVSGKTATFNTESFENYDYDAGGKKAEVTFHKVSGKYSSVSISPK